MNTLTNTPILKNAYSETVILLEDLEFGMTRGQLNKITRLHNAGMDFKEISQEVKRNPYEVILAILHQTRQGKGIRPLAYRRKTNE